jgi:RNA polymerase sigma-70 factor, ECF subfamily
MSTRELDQSGESTPRSFIAPVAAFTDRVEDSDDKVLTVAFKRGDKGAYQAIHDRYSQRVHGVCRRMLLHPEDAEEAAQESFLRVYQALGRFNGRYLLGPWITRITTNVCLDQLRAKGRRPVDLMPVDVLDVHAHCDPDLDPQELHVRRTESRRVRKMLESLPPMYRAAIVLRDFEGLSYSEIATALEITDSQVKALIHRARQAFKRSWSSALLALPLRLVNRVRKVDPGGREHGGNAVTTVQQTTEVVGSIAPVATHCSTVVQQCGQFIAERVAAAAVTVAVIGTGAAATVSGSPAPPPADPTPVHAQDTAATPADLITLATRTKRATPPAADDADPAPSDDAEAAPPVEDPAVVPEEPVAEEPAPEEPTTPTEAPPEPAANGSGEGVEPTPAASPTPPPPAPPAGFTMSFVVQGPQPATRCDCVGPVKVVSSEVGATSAGIERVDQVLTGSASNGSAATYGLWVDHQSPSGTNHSAEFRLYTNEGGYFYAGTGTLVDRVLMDWSGWRYTYRGTYKLSSRPGGTEVMTQSGTYTAVVTASWQENRVVSTDFTVVDGG